VYKTTLFGEVTIEQLVEKLMSIYPELVNQKMKKEDARSFLPSNVNCGKLYMTFTLGSLLKFLELRTDSHAQAEIRSYAKLVKSFVDNHIIIAN
jgi:thymidylate synthase ThyX